MKLLSKPITEFTHEELDQLRSFIYGPEFKKQYDATWEDHRKVLEERYKKNKDARDKVKKREEGEYQYLEAFTKTLKPNMIISFRGTKGSPYRQIVQVNEDSIIGMVVNRRRDKGGNIVLTGNSSENGIANLNGYMDKNGVWRDRKWIVEQGKKL